MGLLNIERELFAQSFFYNIQQSGNGEVRTIVFHTGNEGSLLTNALSQLGLSQFRLFTGVPNKDSYSQNF